MRLRTKVQNFVDLSGLEEEALRLASKGFRVIPISGKVPLVKDWPKAGVRDAAGVRALFRREGVTGVGIVLDDPLVVLDFDPRNGGDWNDYDLPPTVVCHTGGGGRHYYYKLPAGVKSQTKKLYPGVDLKGAGGYVVAPPSIHPSGERYVWEVFASPWEIDIAEAPVWVVEELRGRGEKVYNTPPPIRRGERHSYLVSLAGALCGAGVDAGVVDAILREVYEVHFEKDDFDIEGELANVRKYYERWRGSGDISKVIGRVPAGVREIIVRHVGGRAGRGRKREMTLSTPSRRRIEEVLEVLQKAQWVEWCGVAHIVHGNVLIPSESAQVFLTSQGVYASAEVVKQAVAYISTIMEMPPLKGIVLGEYMVEGEAAGVRGVWRHSAGRLYCHTTNEIRVWGEGEWPEGVYRVARAKGVQVGEGGIHDLISYMKVAGTRIDADPRVITAMLAPVLLGAGDAGFVLTGPAGVGKSMFAKALAMLERGREWGFPVGTHIRDYLASLTAQRITFFDDATMLSSDLQALLRSKITHSWANMRALYKDTDVIERKLEGSMILCSTAVEDLSHDLADRCFFIRFANKGPKVREDGLLRFFEGNCDRARAGLIELWRKSQSVKIARNIAPQVRFRRWLESAYRMAVVLGVEDEFERYVNLSKLYSLSSLKYGFMVDAFIKGIIEAGRAYRLRDIWEALGNDTEDESLVRLARGLGMGQKNRREIETIAQAFRYHVRFEKQVVNKDRGRPELVMIFAPQDDGAQVLEALPTDSGGASQTNKAEQLPTTPTASQQSEVGDSPAASPPSYPLLADGELEAEVLRLMEGGGVGGSITEDEYVQTMRDAVRQCREMQGDSGVARYIADFINASGDVIKEAENRSLLLYLLQELAKARRSICEKK